VPASTAILAFAREHKLAVRNSSLYNGGMGRPHGFGTMEHEYIDAGNWTADMPVGMTVSLGLAGHGCPSLAIAAASRDASAESRPPTKRLARAC
jgi:hypothetical protein